MKKKLLSIIAILSLSFGIGLGISDVNSADSSDPTGGGGFKSFEPDPTEPTKPTEPEPTGTNSIVDPIVELIETIL